ncbi:MAG TPA: response regulator transcription factor [Candidatus Cybelea sp.]|nr:response regulator transcription factor [Candidatus Cybelea sp.]
MSQLNVLLADDQTLFREGLKRLLGDLGEPVTIHEADDLAGIVALTERIPEINFIVLDWAIAGVNGVGGLARVRQLSRGAPVVVLSASTRWQDAKAALSGGAAGYVPKTSNAQVLLGALRLVLAGGIYLPPLLLESNEAAEHARVSADAAAAGLTRRQLEVLVLLSDGKTNRQIAEHLSLSEGTVKLHVAAVFKALKVHSRTQAVMLANRMGLIPDLNARRAVDTAR